LLIILLLVKFIKRDLFKKKDSFKVTYLLPIDAD